MQLPCRWRGSALCFGILLSPALRAVLMSLSTIVKANNARLLRGVVRNKESGAHEELLIGSRKGMLGDIENGRLDEVGVIVTM